MPENPRTLTAGEVMESGFGRSNAEQVADLQAEPAWLRERRLAAWRVFDYLPMPDSNRLEEWRRTDVRDLDLTQFSPYRDPGYRAAGRGDLDPAVAGRLPAETERGAVLVQHDSAVVFRQLLPDLAEQGVIVTDLPTAAREHPDLIRRHLLTDVVQPEMSKFVALHAAFWSGGAFVYVPADRRVELPIEIVTWLGTAGLGSFGHTLIVAETGSQVTVAERYASDNLGRPTLSSAATEIVVGRGARVQHVTLQEWGRGVTAFARQRAVLDADCRFESAVLALGGTLWRGEIETVLAGAGAEAEMFGLVVGNRRQHLDHRTLQYHQAPHTRSNLLYKGVLRDRARSIFVGRIVVPREAQQTESYQANRNLLLTERARADSLPVLEILANDVRCTHGATVGPVDEEQLFYLMARGIPRPVAKQMLVEGFIQAIVDQVPLPDLREQVRNAVAGRVGE